MPLSRLENFLKNAEGNILYVNPSDFDATDSYENRGNSLTRPFKTIQRALLEAARFSYIPGRNNDKIDTTTILVYPGTHYIDNRPGYSIQNSGGTAVVKQYLNGTWTSTGATLTEFTQFSNFDIFDQNNDLRKFNSVNGGVILPRGASIVGLDLRKTKIRPLYVPDPYDDDVENSTIFRVTGTCYFTSFTIFDADLKRSAYKNSTNTLVAPNFSHHKLTCFEYAEGVNNVVIGGTNTGITDLDAYYAKVTFAYGATSGRALTDFPNSAGAEDFEPSIDEYRIVGDLRADSVGITSIRSGNGVIPTRTITVNTTEEHGLYKDTPFLITGITTDTSTYNGSQLVSDVLSPTQFTYTSAVVPINALPNSSEIQNGSVSVEADSVSSASPYIFSCTLRSVYGMNGMHADGTKATGFKSMLVAQFTGISLQKDDNAFILYDSTTGAYNDNLTVSSAQQPLHTNSQAIYRPGWESTHIKASNNAIFQAVSVFAIGFGRHFVAETGGDMSITNSNSNFGALALESNGFRTTSFDRDDVAYITHVIPPREPDTKIVNITWLPLDVKTIVSTARTDRFYLAAYTNVDVTPPVQIDGYRIGAKRGEELYLSVTIGANQSNFSSPILMTVPSGIGTSSEKVYTVGRNVGINSITTNDIITLNGNHQLFNGETIRIFSDTGGMPSNVDSDKIYYAYTSGLSGNQLKLSSTLNDTTIGNTISGLSNGGGVLKVISTVADKLPGDLGHPVQYDATVGQWYITGSPVTLYNTIYDGIIGIGTELLGDTSGATFVTRKLDSRSLDDRLYKFRYVIPKEFTDGRPPTDGFTIQESKTVGINNLSDLTSNLTDTTQLRNTRIIINAGYNAGTVVIKTESEHNLLVGDEVTISNVLSSNNSSSSSSEFFKTPYNGTYTIASVPTPKTFTYTGIGSDPGTFQSLPNARSTQQQILALPTVQRSKSKDSVYIYRSVEIKNFIAGSSGQDGIYNIIPICGSISPDSSVGFGISYRKFNQDIRDLFPQQDRDNFSSDPESTSTHAELYPVGKVTTNDKRKSITKEALNYFIQNTKVGFAITGGVVSGAGNTTITLYTETDHNFNSIKSVSIVNPGAGYNNSAGISTILYSTDLENGSLIGNFASVKATVSTGNTITSVQIVDGGAAYGVGNTLTISASPAAAPSTYAVVQVTAINNVIGDTLELGGFYEPRYNGIFKIVDVPNTRSISIYNPNGIGVAYTSRNDSRLPQIYLTSQGVRVTNLTFTPSTGVATVTNNNPHGLLPGNSFGFVGLTTSNYFNKKFTVSGVVGVNTFTFNAGITTASPSTTVTGVTLHKYGFSSNGKFLTAGEETLGGRGSYIYAGITTTLSASITSSSTTITLTSSGGFKRGDYVAIGGEIIRLVSNPTTNTFDVLRGQFSTLVASASVSTPVKKIRVLPVELRRHSILRASGHTFEYLGYGPGNYSTGLPLKQDRLLNEVETLVSQARQQDGGTVVYTGMNDKGEFYSGATKVNGATGETTIIQAPVVTYTGDDASSVLTQKNSAVFDDTTIKDRITVEGGDNNNQTSQFYGPVNFSQKVTVAADQGLETINFYLKGDASQSKLMTVGIQTPTSAKKSGDIIFLSNPTPGGYIGFVYADNQWNRWGMISKERDRDFLVLDQVGVGQSSGIYNFTDAAEVNGTLKVKNLYVGGAVTFAGAQAIGSGEFDNITVNKTITFNGIGTNYSLVHTNANTIAQFQNLEVIGYAATFTNATVKFQNSFNSTFNGISTVAGTLVVNNLQCTTGILTVTEFRGTQIGIDTITVNKNAFITSGIITNFKSNVGTCTNFYSNVGVITSLTGVACTITTVNGTNLFITNGRIGTLDAPSLYSNSGIITALTSTNGTVTNLTGTAVTYTTVLGSSYVSTPLGYISSGIVTNLYGSTLSYGTGYINSGIVTTISGTTATYTNIKANTSLVVPDGSGLYANVGVVTIMSGTQASYSGIVTASILKSTVAQGTAPLQVTSTTKVSNLNADLLDDLNTSSTDTSGNTIVSRSSGNFSAGTVTATLAGNVDQTANGYLRVNNAYVSSGGDYAHLATHEWYNGSVWTTDATVGGMFQITGQTFNWYKHNGAGTHTTLLALDASGNLSATGYVESQSDEKLKTNIKTIDNALDKVCQLRGVEYDRVDIESHQIGVIAQEVEKVFPEIVSENSEGTKSVAYGNLVGALIESIKELKGEITELRQELDILKGNK